MDEIRETLEKQIMTDLEKISKQDLGSKERAEAINQIVSLHRLEIDAEKLGQEKEAQDKDRDIKKKLEIAGIAVPNILLGLSLVAGYLIEKDGVITRKTTDKILRFFRPEKLTRFFRF